MQSYSGNTVNSLYILNFFESTVPLFEYILSSLMLYRFYAVFYMLVYDGNLLWYIYDCDVTTKLTLRFTRHSYTIINLYITAFTYLFMYQFFFKYFHILDAKDVNRLDFYLDACKARQDYAEMKKLEVNNGCNFW